MPAHNRSPVGANSELTSNPQLDRSGSAVVLTRLRRRLSLLVRLRHVLVVRLSRPRTDTHGPRAAGPAGNASVNEAPPVYPRPTPGVLGPSTVPPDKMGVQ